MGEPVHGRSWIDDVNYTVRRQLFTRHNVCVYNSSSGEPSAPTSTCLTCSFLLYFPDDPHHGDMVYSLDLMIIGGCLRWPIYR